MKKRSQAFPLPPTRNQRPPCTIRAARQQVDVSTGAPFKGGLCHCQRPADGLYLEFSPRGQLSRITTYLLSALLLAMSRQVSCQRVTNLLQSLTPLLAGYFKPPPPPPLTPFRRVLLVPCLNESGYVALSLITDCVISNWRGL